MQLRLIQPALGACVFLLGLHSLAGADSTPRPSPPPTVPPLPSVTPTPTVSPIPTVPPVSPSPVATPTVPPISPSPIPSPTVNTSPIDKYLPEPWKPPPTPTVSPIPTIPPILPTPPPVNPENSIPVVIDYGGGQQTTAIIYAGVMEPVGVPRAQSVSVTLFLPAAYAGQVMRIGLYDGGHAGAAAPPGSEMVATQAFEVRGDGIVQFNFKAGQTLGLYRVLATIGADQHLLQFYAVTPRPSSGSPAATEVNGPIVSPTVDPLPIPSPSPTPEKWPSPST